MGMSYTSNAKSANVTITRIKGDSFYFAFQVSVFDFSLNQKVPVDLSSYTKAKMKVRENEFSDSVVTFSHSGATNTIDISYLDRGQIVISGGELVLNPSQYLYDLELSNNDSKETIIAGRFIVTNEVTY